MSLDIFDVSGQKVLLTGAGRGIGKGIALAFAQAGAGRGGYGVDGDGGDKDAEEVRALGRVCLPLTGTLPLPRTPTPSWRRPSRSSGTLTHW